MTRSVVLVGLYPYSTTASSASFALFTIPFMSLLFDSVLYEGEVALKSSFDPSEEPRALPASFSTPASIPSSIVPIHFLIIPGVLAIVFPVFQSTSPVFCTHLITHSFTIGADFCTAPAHTKFANSSTPTHIFSSWRF